MQYRPTRARMYYKLISEAVANAGGLGGLNPPRRFFLLAIMKIPTDLLFGGPSPPPPPPHPSRIPRSAPGN